MGWIPWELPKPNYPRLQLTDELLLYRLKNAPVNGKELVADLIYLDQYIVDEVDGWNVAALVFIMADTKSDMIVCADLVPPQIDEQVAVITGFANYVEANGRMRRVRVRNPYVFAALKETCKKCKIQLQLDDLPEMDEIAEDMAGFVERDFTAHWEPFGN